MDWEETSTSEEEAVREESDEALEEAEDQQEPESAAQREAREKREEEERQERARKRKLIPPFVMLLAGAIISITMRILHYETKTMLIILLCVLIGFYILGYIIKIILDMNMTKLDDEFTADDLGFVDGEILEDEETTDEEEHQSENG